MHLAACLHSAVSTRTIEQNITSGSSRKLQGPDPTHSTRRLPVNDDVTGNRQNKRRERPNLAQPAKTRLLQEDRY
ncbi:hypothetical protein L798_00522 [Zootermopsis nevadensis]|uniref:Uncharacterized protein n=1 Tax=Zootermopsis nevadensis TaxID=136037 RepID=A0A067QXR5_ZOONE|nr:hypothetical protein L798_00522 [Zootermopsis nevadensis]